MAFSGPAPERTNGRLAMLGFVAAVAAELVSGGQPPSSLHHHAPTAQKDTFSSLQGVQCKTSQVSQFEVSWCTNAMWRVQLNLTSHRFPQGLPARHKLPALHQKGNSESPRREAAELSSWQCWRRQGRALSVGAGANAHNSDLCAVRRRIACTAVQQRRQGPVAGPLHALCRDHQRPRRHVSSPARYFTFITSRITFRSAQANFLICWCLIDWC